MSTWKLIFVQRICLCYQLPWLQYSQETKYNFLHQSNSCYILNFCCWLFSYCCCRCRPTSDFCVFCIVNVTLFILQGTSTQPWILEKLVNHSKQIMKRHHLKFDEAKISIKTLKISSSFIIIYSWKYFRKSTTKNLYCHFQK